MKSLYVLFLTLISTSQLSQVRCENVLVLCQMRSRSHKNIAEAMIEGLARRNHSVMVVSGFATPINSPNIRDIVIENGYDPYVHRNALEIRSSGIIGNIDFSIFKSMAEGCHATFKNQEFMKLLDHTFDLIIIDGFGNHCLHPIARKLKAPVIRYMSVPMPAAFAIQTGNYLPTSFVPEVILPFSDKMNFLERTVNLVVSNLMYTPYFSWYDEHEKIARQYLGEDIPSLAELDSDISLTLVNSHFSINKPRPTMPDVVEIGGVHCRPGRPLPNDLAKFVDEGENGLILFSLGSIFRSKDMPEETRLEFVNAFSRIEQRILWKWDFEDMPDLPSNVKLSKWLPVQDILAHPNTKLFITHGGLQSTMEAICHGVPMVGIPLFADQDSNINRYVNAGIAVFVEILKVQEKEISEAIDVVLNNPEYKTKVQSLSDLIRDQPQSAIDTAVFWSEYVMRHKGAPQLRSAARNLNFIQYHCLDVIAFLSALLVGLLCIIFLVARKVYWKVFGANGVSNTKEKSL